MSRVEATSAGPPIGPGILAPQASQWRELTAAASEPYRRAGRFALYFARGKLRRDPVFRHVLANGLIAPRSRVLDIGCGQGLLASLLQAVTRAARESRWPSDWAAAPVDVRVSGIEVMPRDIVRARDALGDEAELVCGDMRSVAFPSVDAVVILDVLHYVSVEEQDALLTRVRAALPADGRLLLRVGDAGSRTRFVASQWVDRIVARVRGHRSAPQHGRSLDEWKASLGRLGFAVTSQPMHEGTPFANVLLVARLGDPGHDSGRDPGSDPGVGPHEAE